MDIGKIIEKGESQGTGFWGWAAALFAVLLIRTVFESLLEVWKKPQIFEYFFFHYFLSWISIFLSIILILKIFSGEKISKTSRMTIVFYPLIFIVPVIDFVVSGGRGYNLGYVFGNAQYLLEQAASFFSNFPERGVTIGEKTLIVLAVFFSGVYSWAKTKKYWKGIAAGAAVYASLLFYAFFFSILGIISYGPEAWEASGYSLTGELLISGNYLYAGLIIFQLVLWVFFWNRKKFFALAKNLRPSRAVHYAGIMPLFGVLVFYYLNPFESTSMVNLPALKCGASAVQPLQLDSVA